MSEICRFCEADVLEQMRRAERLDLLKRFNDCAFTSSETYRKMKYQIENLQRNNNAAMKVIYNNNLYSEFIEEVGK